MYLTPEDGERFKRLLLLKLSEVPGFPFAGMHVSLAVAPDGSGGGGVSFDDGVEERLAPLYTDEQYANCASWNEEYTGTEEEKSSSLSEMFFLDTLGAVHKAVAECWPADRRHLEASISNSILSLTIYISGHITDPLTCEPIPLT